MVILLTEQPAVNVINLSFGGLEILPNGRNAVQHFLLPSLFLHLFYQYFPIHITVDNIWQTQNPFHHRKSKSFRNRTETGSPLLRVMLTKCSHFLRCI